MFLYVFAILFDNFSVLFLLYFFKKAAAIAILFVFAPPTIISVKPPPTRNRWAWFAFGF